jgi:hypothetical protein
VLEEMCEGKIFGIRREILCWGKLKRLVGVDFDFFVRIF